MIDVESCLSQGIPFAVWRDPQGTISGSDKARVTIHPWLSSKKLAINDSAPAPLEPMRAQKVIDRGEYVERVGRLVGRICERGGKTVYSRTLEGRGEASPSEVLTRLLALDQPTLRIMWYHPGCGLWIASTPEVLLDVDLDSQRFTTMALAGTRRRSTPGPWDAKNLKEQSIVTDTIVADLRRLGLEPEISQPSTLASGGVEHICTLITGELRGVDPSLIAATLSPTPALCGQPRAAAIEDIAEFEDFDRDCYGGYVEIADSQRLRAYVVLRCARIDLEGRYRLYAGGGITADSNPEAEWLETEAKFATIKSLLKID